MPTIKVINRILLVYVAFSVSFGLGFLASRNFARAMLIGMICIPASYTGAVVADRRRILQEKRHWNSLQHQVQSLEEQHNYLNQSLSGARASLRDIEARVNALRNERNYLLSRVTELHHQRNELYQELTVFQQQTQQQEGEYNHLQTQLQQLERNQSLLKQSLWAKSIQIQPTETRLNRVRAELEQLRQQIIDKRQQRHHLTLELTRLDHQKQQLGGETYDLQTQIQVLEQRQIELNRVLLSLQERKQELESNITPLQAELEQLQHQVVEQQQQQTQLTEVLSTLDDQKQQLASECKELQNQIQTLEARQTELHESLILESEIKSEITDYLPESWREWLEFVQQLSSEEQHVLLAILEDDTTRLKQIADEQSTMPQVLIDTLNEKALNVCGDILLSNGAGSTVDVGEEYQSVFNEPIALYFKDILKRQQQTDLIESVTPAPNSSSTQAEN